MDRLKIGWVGNYRRIPKRFDVALKYCSDFGHDLCVASFPKTVLHRPHNEMPEFYRTKDVLLSTSVKEAHPLAVYEALSCETPVAMLDVGDCSAEGITGICYYTYLDSEVINDCITEIMDDSVAYGRAGRQEILKRWQWKHWIPTYVKMFQDVSGLEKGIRLGIIVDKPDWAWDIMAKILVNELSKTGCFLLSDIVYTRGVEWDTGFNVKKFKHGKYDVLLNHCWQTYNHFDSPDFPHKKNIPCANGAAYLEKQWAKRFTKIANKAPALTTVSKVIAKDLQSRFSSVYHCSRGVDTELFKP